jgi:hypothetical protein
MKKYLFLFLLSAVVPFAGAAEKNKAGISLILFTDSIKCPACIRLHNQVLSAPDVKQELKKFSRIITADRSRKETMHVSIVKEVQKQIHGRIRLPSAVILGEDGKVNGIISGFLPKTFYLKELCFYRELPPLFQTVIRGKESDLQSIMSTPGYVKASPIGTTALITAIRLQRDDEFLRTMIRLSDKKTLQRQDSFLRTALHYAAEANRKEIVKLLLDAGVNPILKDVRGDTAASLARQAGHHDVAELLSR